MATDRAVLWDLDGTLLDPRGSIRATLDAVLAEQGLASFDPETRRLVGMPLRDILRLRSDDERLVEHMTRRYREVFEADGWRPVRPIPGVLEVVDTMAAVGVPNAVVTTKGEAEATLLLDRLGLRDRFATVVGDDDKRPLKPDAAPLCAACGRLGVAPERSVMVGDTVFDVAAARAAGTHAIGVLWGHGSREELEPDAHWIAADPAALEAALAAWRALG